MSEEKIEITKSELEELVERKVEEKLKKNENSVKSEESDEISRRNFLKKLGAGAIGLGALTLPTSALSVRDSDFDVFTGSGPDSLTNYFSVDSSGVKVSNTSLDVNGTLTVSNSTGSEVIQAPTYSTESDLPSEPEGSIAYVTGTGSLYVEDGT